MDRDSFSSANSSPPIRISRGTQKVFKEFNNCNLTAFLTSPTYQHFVKTSTVVLEYNMLKHKHAHKKDEDGISHSSVLKNS